MAFSLQSSTISLVLDPLRHAHPHLTFSFSFQVPGFPSVCGVLKKKNLFQLCFPVFTVFKIPAAFSECYPRTGISTGRWALTMNAEFRLLSSPENLHWTRSSQDRDPCTFKSEKHWPPRWSLRVFPLSFILEVYIGTKFHRLYSSFFHSNLPMLGIPLKSLNCNSIGNSN